MPLTPHPQDCKPASAGAAAALAAASFEDLSLEQVAVVVDGGIVMALGPEGDPVPPQAFCRAASSQPGATVKGPAGARLAGQRVAAVLDAQSRGQLAPAKGGAEDWLLAMLGVGPQPAQASESELAVEEPALAFQASACELTAFAKELLITLPGSGSLLLASLASKAGDVPCAWLTDRKGAAVALAEMLARLRSEGAGEAAGADPVTCRGAELRAEHQALILATAAGDRYLITPSPQAAAPANRVGIFLSDGTPATVEGVRARLRALPPPGAAQAGNADRPAGPQAKAALDDRSEPEASVALDLPQDLILGSSGVLDLRFLAQVPERLRAAAESVTIAGLPAGVLLSSGTPATDGRYTLSSNDLQTLSLFATPEHDLFDFALTVTFETSRGTARGKVPVAVLRAQPIAVQAVPSGAGMLAVPLTFRPPLAPQNDLSRFAVVLLSGVPAGARLSAGLDAGEGRWMLSPGDLQGLALYLSADSRLPFTLGVKAVSIESRDGALAASTQTLVVSAPADLDERSSDRRGWALPVDLSRALEAVPEGARIQAIAVTGLPSDLRFSHGTRDEASGCWVLRPEEVNDLHLLMPGPQPRRIPLRLAVVSIGHAARRRSVTTRALDLEVRADGSVLVSDPQSAAPGRVGTIGFFRPSSLRRH